MSCWIRKEAQGHRWETYGCPSSKGDTSQVQPSRLLLRQQNQGREEKWAPFTTKHSLRDRRRQTCHPCVRMVLPWGLLAAPGPTAAPAAPQPAEESQEPAQCPTALPNTAACRGRSSSPAHRLALPPVLVGSATGFLKAGRGSRLGLHLVQKTRHLPRAVLTAHMPPPHVSTSQCAGANGPPTWLGQAGPSGKASVCRGAVCVRANTPPATHEPPATIFPFPSSPFPSSEAGTPA